MIDPYHNHGHPAASIHITNHTCKLLSGNTTEFLPEADTMAILGKRRLGKDGRGHHSHGSRLTSDETQVPHSPQSGVWGLVKRGEMQDSHAKSQTMSPLTLPTWPPRVLGQGSFWYTKTSYQGSCHCSTLCRLFWAPFVACGRGPNFRGDDWEKSASDSGRRLYGTRTLRGHVRRFFLRCGYSMHGYRAQHHI